LQLCDTCASCDIVQVPAVSVNDDGKVERISERIDVERSRDDEAMDNNGRKNQTTLKAKRSLKLGAVPVSLTCMLHKKYLLADPTAEEEAVLRTTFTVVLSATGRLISMYKPGGSILATTSTVQVLTLSSKNRIL
jgi:exosome complex component RRP43